MAAYAVATPCADLNASQLSLSGAKIIDFRSSTVRNYSSAGQATAFDFCNVSVAYTHQGRDDLVHASIWMPHEGWNDRLQGIGGGGFQMGAGPTGLAPAVAAGYAAAQTDGGHGNTEQSSDPRYWALDSSGNVNLGLLEDYAFRTLGELALIAKSIVHSFYDRPAKYTYWNGCSTGGRQGLMLAQRFPEAFDGILASSPLVHWPKTATATYWAQLVMSKLKYYPRPCELAAIHSWAVEACDELDGVRDGIVSLPTACTFDARWKVGKVLNTCKDNSTLTMSAALIANAAWEGPSDLDGHRLWYGINKDANLVGVANTTCSNSTCMGAPFSIGDLWLRYFLAKDPSFSVTNMTQADYVNLFHRSVQEYQSVLGTNDPDLSSFRARGGKMLTVHGLADEVVPPSSTAEYYHSVLTQDAAAASFYRLFEAPGVGHCALSAELWPQGALEALERWVEDGQAPDTLNVTSKASVRPLCPFPKVQKYINGDTNRFGSYACV